MHKTYLLGFLIIILIFGVVGLVNAIGVKVIPSEIKVEIKVGQIVEEGITIENPDQDVVLYEIYSDNFSDWLELKPSSFILEGGEIKDIKLQIKGQEVGIFLTTISVVAKPLASTGFKINSGIKIPLEIIVSQKDNQISMASISLFFSEQFSVAHLIALGVIILLVYLIVILLKRK